MSRGFVRIELLIIVIVLLLSLLTVSLAFFSANVQARDQKRVTDIKQIQKALNVYFTQNGFYPTGQAGEPTGIETYLDFWPHAPRADGNCSTAQNNYNYSQKSNGEDYLLTFCLGRISGSLLAGPHILNSNGIQ